MKTENRKQWILDYIRKHGSVDILNQKFVGSYINDTNAPFEAMVYGADRCSRLGADLRALFVAKLVKRSRLGVHGMAGQGMPKWVYVYDLI